MSGRGKSGGSKRKITRSVSKAKGWKKTGLLRKASAVTNYSSNSMMASESLNSQNQGSRFHNLSQLCKVCDNPCTPSSDDVTNDVKQCASCKIWVHRECEVNDQQMVEMREKGQFLCVDCNQPAIESSSNTSATGSDSTNNSNRSDLSVSMNSEERFRAQFDGAIADNNVEMSEINVSQNQDVRPKTSSPKDSPVVSMAKLEKETPKSVVEIKIDEMMACMKNDSQELNARMQNIEEQHRGFMNSNYKIIDQSIKMNLGLGLANLQKSIEQNLNKDFDTKIDKTVDEKLDAKVDKLVEEKMKGIEKRLDYKIKTAEQNIEKRIEKNMDSKIDVKLNKGIEEMVDQATTRKISGAFEEFNEKLWRKRNVLVVNIPESQKRDIEERKHDDMMAILPIFNKFIKCQESDIEGLPVRVGLRQGDRPRMLRVSLISRQKLERL